MISLFQRCGLLDPEFYICFMISTEELYSIYQRHPRISTDTRAIIPGSVFFSLKGPSFNGNAFAEKALELGAAYAVVDEPEFQKNDRCLLVGDGLIALQQLANYHRHQLTIPVLAVTGSNGKTTTKELIRSVLSKRYNTLATKGNLNNHIGVPLTLLSISPDIEFAVIEMGANHQGEIESYCKIAEPHYGLITNVGKAHLEGFGGFEGVKKGKGELYAWIASHSKTIFLNGNNSILHEMAKDHKVQYAVVYGTEDGFDCSGALITDSPTLEVKWKQGDHSGQIQSQIIGAYNFENILAAVCIGNYFGVSAEAIDEAIAAYVPDNSRSQVVKKGTNTIILDAYNANPTSMEAALKNFASLPVKHKILCIGDMAELGEDSADEHRRIVEIVKTIPTDQVILVGKNFGFFSGQLKCLHFENSETAADWVKKHPFSNKQILIKGSRSSKMEKILESI